MTGGPHSGLLWDFSKGLALAEEAGLKLLLHTTRESEAQGVALRSEITQELSTV